MPVHWQLPSSATLEERERLCFEFLQHVLNTHCRFSCEDKRECFIYPGLPNAASVQQEMDITTVRSRVLFGGT